MQSTLQHQTLSGADLAGRVFDRLAIDLGMILDREIELELAYAEEVRARSAGEDQVHISFKVGLNGKHGRSSGCFLIPLPDAMTLAGLLMMLEDHEIEDLRKTRELERAEKDALLEVGNFVAGALDTVIRTWMPGASAHSEGCQGVRAGVRPALDYDEGDPLLQAQGSMSVEGFTSCPVTLLLPTPDEISAEIAA